MYLEERMEIKYNGVAIYENLYPKTKAKTA